MNRSRVLAMVIVAWATLTPGVARADEVTDWTEQMFRAHMIAAASPLNTTRSAAIVQTAIFDAVNGIEKQYAHIRVAPAAPAGASKNAAVMQAAYATLVSLFPTQKPAFDSRRAVSMTEIGSHESAASIQAGVTWGQTVADAIIAWRNTDGFTPAPPPFLGGMAPGQWRPTPPANAPGAGPQFAYMTPWAIQSPSQFRPAGPPALDSARYAIDFNETKSMGSATSTLRTPDQTIASWFWASSTASYIWNAVALDLIDHDGREWDDDAGGRWHSKHDDSLVSNARLLALLQVAIADAAIGCWDAKYTYVFWRPITAIQLGDTDGNPATTPDPSWAPLFATPAHPEYPSGHSCVSGAATAVLADRFGERTRFSVQSDTMLGVTRSYRSFSSALEDVKDARIFAGIHFRKATEDGTVIGSSVAEYVLDHVAERVH
jgi:hypothetical protein